ncbi:hypothetical protein BASA50_004608 [Batrachochytrium salamandrivorans]|uniref:DUF676 domain-containing protein n=1 Tax=Batrachochytrium salamandrivorans TaxID=1357716 RepID=A0ABQ8FF57_9FUNG|nr:hypothetical protein BASA62_008761 [Batrachochytrium salamandrivorans]KAH6597257.1 hypothetical protein BASA50_004608 [Batrachochytrium salamandrivorans]KAH6602413.1 hypothetical protein BASA61_001125 [Batrachochytrium salamandrivorans]
MALQQSVQVCVCFGHFTNVDVYQRGLYKIQCRLYKKSHQRNSLGRNSPHKRIDGTPIRVVHLEKLLQCQTPESRWDPRFQIFPAHTLERVVCPLRHHKKCTWRCCISQDAPAQTTSLHSPSVLRASAKTPVRLSAMGRHHIVFSTNTFNLSVQGEVIPLMCGVVFELKEVFCDATVPDDESCAYLEVQLYFIDDETSNDPDSLQLQQTHEIRINDFMTTHMNPMQHHTVTFDSVFFATCDVAIATSPVQFEIEDEKSSTSSTANTLGTSSLGESIFSSISGILGTPWISNHQQENTSSTRDTSTYTSPSSNTNITSPSLATSLPILSSTTMAVAQTEIRTGPPVYQLLISALGSIATILDLNIESSELQEYSDLNTTLASPVQSILNAIQESLPNLQEDIMRSIYESVADEHSILDKPQRKSLMRSIGGCYLQQKNQAALEASYHMFKLVANLKPQMQSAWKYYLECIFSSFESRLSGMRSSHTLIHLERMCDQITCDQLQSSLEFLAQSRKKKAFLDNFPADRYPSLIEMQQSDLPLSSTNVQSTLQTPRTQRPISSQSLTKKSPILGKRSSFRQELISLPNCNRSLSGSPLASSLSENSNGFGASSSSENSMSSECGPSPAVYCMKQLDRALGRLTCEIQRFSLSKASLDDIGVDNRAHFVDSSQKSLPGYHLIVFVHGLLGSSFDFRQYRNRFVCLLIQLGIPLSYFRFLNSSSYEDDTFEDINFMANLLTEEVVAYIRSIQDQTVYTISFICHSLGGIIARCALRNPLFQPYYGRFNAFVTLAAPHFSLSRNQNAILSSMMGIYQAISRSRCINQLNMLDHPDARQTLLYQLASDTSLYHFRNILFFGARQDKYVSFEGALGLDTPEEIVKTPRRRGTFEASIGLPLGGGASVDKPPVQTSSSNMATVISEMAFAFNRVLSQVPHVQRYAVQFPRMDDPEYIGTLFGSDPLGRKAHLAMIEDPGMIEMVILVSSLGLPTETLPICESNASLIGTYDKPE